MWQTSTTVASMGIDAGVGRELLAFSIQLMDQNNEPASSIDRSLVAFVYGILEPDQAISIAQMRAALAVQEKDDPTHPSVIDMRAAVRFKLEYALAQHDEAIAFSEETVARIRQIVTRPSKALANELKEQAGMLRNRGDFEKALLRAREAVACYKQVGIDCDLASVLSGYDLVGFCLIRTGRNEEAFTHYTTALRDLLECSSPNPDAHIMFHFNRACAAYWLGRFPEGIADINAATALIPKLPKAKHEAERARMADMLKALEKGKAQ